MTIYYAVVEGDPLDNGGNSHVIDGALHSTIEGPDGRFRQQTHLGQKAWCSVCESVGVIVAKAGISDHLRGWDGIIKAFEGVGGDIVVCKCARPPRIISQYARTCEYIDVGVASSHAGSAKLTPYQSATHDEQFILFDGAGRPMPMTLYTIRNAAGTLVHGVTESDGKTARHTTSDAQSITLYLGHRATYE